VKNLLESSLASGKENIDDIILEKFKKDKNLKIAEDFLQFNPATNTVYNLILRLIQLILKN